MIALQVLSGILSLVSLGCFIMVLVKMFSAGDTGLGIACAVGIFVCGIGALVAFIMGWVKVNDYDIKPIMMAWSACFVLNILLSVAVAMMNPALQG